MSLERRAHRGSGFREWLNRTTAIRGSLGAPEHAEEREPEPDIVEFGVIGPNVELRVTIVKLPEE